MMRNFLTALAGCLLLAGAARAQEEEQPATSQKDEVLAALDLPAAAQKLRARGVEKEQVREALETARKKKVRVRATKGLLDEAAAAADEHGPIDNFGAFVKAKLDEGLRGRDLAAAIRAEHAARGKGKGHAKKMQGGKPEDRVKEPRGRGTDDEEPAEDRPAGQRGGQGKGRQGGRNR